MSRTAEQKDIVTLARLDLLAQRLKLSANRERWVNEFRDESEAHWKGMTDSEAREFLTEEQDFQQRKNSVYKN